MQKMQFTGQARVTVFRVVALTSYGSAGRNIVKRINALRRLRALKPQGKSLPAI